MHTFQRTTATTITIEIIEPSKPNGYLEKYKVYLNGEEVSSQLSVNITNYTENKDLKVSWITKYFETCEST